jgi:murein DD-endopeptidase MepM/ murein hydrolase activator NlpD
MVLALAAMAFLSSNPAGSVEPPPCTAVHAPLGASLGDRREHRPLKRRIQSRFGDGRVSFVRGHLHAGLDLAAKASEPVFAICEGVVVDQHLDYPHTTLVVAHQLEGGRTVYSSYKHVADVKVKVGDRVAADTQLARVFNRGEQRGAGWRRRHLHFEMRHRIEDEGSASWTSMTREDLERYAFDPAPFFAERLQAGDVYP